MQIVPSGRHSPWRSCSARSPSERKITGLLPHGHRVSQHAEELGLDLPEMGALAYPDMGDVASGVVLSPLDVHQSYVTAIGD